MEESKNKLIKEYNDMIATLGDIQKYHNTKSYEAGVAKDNLQLVSTVLQRVDLHDASAEKTIAEIIETAGAYNAYLEGYRNKYVTDTTSLAVSGLAVSSTTVASLSMLPTVGDISDLAYNFCEVGELKPTIANRLRNVDSRLESLYKAAYTSFYSGQPEAERTTLANLRHLLDELISYFSPDNEVRNSKFFDKKKRDKPDQIYRVERITFAANTYGKDKALINTLVAEGKQINGLYSDLNKLHARADVERSGVRVTLKATEKFIELFLDVLGR